VAAFLAVAVIGAVSLRTHLWMMRRRASRQRQSELAWGVRHSQPLWMPLANALLALGVGALIAAIPAAIGFPGVGVGVLLVFAIVAAGTVLVGVGPRALTFEPEGLRLHVRGGSFVVPWTAIDRVERIGPEHTTLLRVHVFDARLVIDSCEPNDPHVLPRVESCVSKAGGGGGEIAFMPWTAGIDGVSLARTIEGALRGQTDQPN
jgi:hypothetical protein